MSTHGRSSVTMGQDLRNTIFYDSVSTNGGDLRMGHNKNGCISYMCTITPRQKMN
jgi:hypothetical protein